MKRLDFLAATALFGNGCLIGNAVNRSMVKNYLYPLTTVVTEVNRGADVVTCADYNGNEWQFSGCEDWAENDICSLLMTTNETVGIYDDSIVKAIYGGNVDNYVDMETVEDFKANADGLMLYLTDGTGYWLEK